MLLSYQLYAEFCFRLVRTMCFCEFFVPRIKHRKERKPHKFHINTLGVLKGCNERCFEFLVAFSVELHAILAEAIANENHQHLFCTRCLHCKEHNSQDPFSAFARIPHDNHGSAQPTAAICGSRNPYLLVVAFKIQLGKQAYISGVLVVFSFRIWQVSPWMAAQAQVIHKTSLRS